MATIALTIPDDKANLIIESFAKVYGYQETIQDENMQMVPNPVSKTQFTKNIIKSFILDVHTSNKLRDIEITRQTLIEEAKADTSGITVS